ncbi:hypothetical protein Emag_003247 [Eimeria magna]
MVKCMSFAAYVLRKEREESAEFGLKQHFRQRRIGQSASPSWWLKARELKEMVKRLSASRQRPTSPQHEWFELIKLISETPLKRYWIGRICSLEPNFRKLFGSLRLPEEQHDSVPCSEVSALIMLASIMSEVTLVVRRRFIAKEKTRIVYLRRVLSFLDTNEVPTPCNKPESSPPTAASPDSSSAPEAAQCRSREAAVNLFLHMKSQKDVVHVQTDDLIQLIRAKFTPVLYSRLSPGFISDEKHERRRQAARFRAMDEEVSDLYAALHRPFDVWQGTFQQRLRHEFLEIRMQQQCPFRHPQATQHAKEVVPGAHVPLLQGFMPFGYKGKSCAALRPKDLLSDTTWPLLEYLQHQAIPISNDPEIANALQCNALKSLRMALIDLGLQKQDTRIEAVVEGFLKDLNFAEISSFLPPPVEGLDAFAFVVRATATAGLKSLSCSLLAVCSVPVGFLRLQFSGSFYSTLVTPSGDAVFGYIQHVAAENSHGSRILVKIRKDAESLHLENTASNTVYHFMEPTECNPGSTLSIEVLRSAWMEKEADIDSGSFFDQPFGSWKDAATHYVGVALQRQDPSGLCHDQHDFLVEEVLNAISHSKHFCHHLACETLGVSASSSAAKLKCSAILSLGADTPVRVGDKAWSESTLVTLERIEEGVKFVRSVGQGKLLKATRSTLFHKEKIRVGDYVQVTAPISGIVYELLQIQPISRTGCVAKLRQVNTGELSLSRSPLIKVPGFKMGELVRKPSSIEVYEYQGTCGSFYEIKNYVTGSVEWTSEDLIPLWGQVAKAFLYENRLPDLLVLLKEFCKTEASQISRSDFRMVLRLLVSHQKLPESNVKSIHTTFDRRANKSQFYETVGMVQRLASELMTSLENQLGFSHSEASDKELLHAWGSASLGALEAMWRSRQLWRMLYKIHQEGFALFFAEVANLPQRPDVRAAVLPSPSAAVPRPAVTPQHTSEEGTDAGTAPWLSHFIDFIGESVLPTKKALRAWEDYITSIEAQVQAFSTQQKALDEYREALQNKDSVFPQSSLAAVWSDTVLLQLWEKIGGLMEKELGNKVPPAVIKQAIKPVIFQELVEVSALTFKDDTDKEKVFEKVSEFLAEEVSKVHQIQNPGRPPKADVLLDIFSLLQVDRQDLKRLEKRMRDQYHLLSRKYVAELVSDELIGIDGVLDMIGALESMLSSMLTPLIDRALGLVKKVTKVFSKTRHKKRHFLFAFDALAAALEKLPAREPPSCKFEPDAQIAVSRDDILKGRSFCSVQDSMWNSGVQPWFDSMKEQGETLGRLLRKMGRGESLNRHWWKELPLLIFLKQSLDDARLSTFAPGVLHMIWTQIKLVTSASSGLYKVLMAPVQGLGAYLYLLLIELLHNLLPAENGYDVDGELEDTMRELIFRIGDDLVRLWPGMPVGVPGQWQG